MLNALRRNRRRIARLVAGLFVAVFVMGAAAPCVMAASSCPGMTAAACPHPADHPPAPCDATHLIDCKRPDTNTLTDLSIHAVVPLPVAIALLPVAQSLPGMAPAGALARYRAGLPPPPPNLRNAILLI